MHVDHPREVGDLHLGKGFVAQDTGIGAQQIDATPLPGGAIDHGLNLFEIRNVGAVGHRHAAGLFDLLDHGFRRRQ